LSLLPARRELGHVSGVLALLQEVPMCIVFSNSIPVITLGLIQLKKKFEKSVTMLGELQDTRAARDELLSEFHEHELVRIPGLTQSLVNLVKAESSSAPLGGAFIPQQTCVLHMLFPR